MNEEADEIALVGPVDGKCCFKNQTDGMVGSVVVGCAGAPCIEATVLTAVGPGSNPTSEGLLLRVIPPLSAFGLFLSVLSIKRQKKPKKNPNVLLLKLIYSVIIQCYTKIHVKKISSHRFQVKYLYSIKMRLISIN